MKRSGGARNGGRRGASDNGWRLKTADCAGGMRAAGNEPEMFLMMACAPIPSLIVSQAFVKV